MAVLARNTWGHGPMASAVARAYNGGLGQSPQPLVRGGAKPPEAEAFLVFRLSVEAANLPTFLKFGNANKSHICVIFANKNKGWPRNWGGLEQNWVACAPQPRPKTATGGETYIVNDTSCLLYTSDAADE